MNKLTYEARGAIKHVEEDIFLGGCLPDTAEVTSIDILIKSETLEELLIQIESLYMVDRSDMLMDACEEEGRLDVQRMEDRDGCFVTVHEIEAWKQNDLRLWLACYSFEIKKVMFETVKLSSLIEHRKSPTGTESIA